MPTYYQDINNAIKTMHYRYGVGDVKSIERYADGRIVLTAQGFGMRPHVRRGRIVNGRTIKMYRHQLTITQV